MKDSNSSINSNSIRRTDKNILAELENESIYILRTAAKFFDRSAVLFSGGKDSAVVLHLARKAFFPNQIPFLVLHIDTGHNFPEVIEYRDSVAGKFQLQMKVFSVQESIDNGEIYLEDPIFGSRNVAQAVTLKKAIKELKLNCCIGGARRDEDKARAKERIFSIRDENSSWDPLNQRPEIGDHYNCFVTAKQQMRAFPISNWSEIDVWSYISQEKIELPTLYYSHMRPILKMGEFLMPVTEFTPAKDKIPENMRVRFRTVGDILCTSPVLSNATNADEVILELSVANISERGATRRDDLTTQFSMEKRKRQGYF
jgi:sulfate adenylyltransferase subunit 2